MNKSTRNGVNAKVLVTDMIDKRIPTAIIAQGSGVGLSTVERILSGKPVRTSTLLKVKLFYDKSCGGIDQLKMASADLQNSKKAAARSTKRIVNDLKKFGFTFADIARFCGCTRQSVRLWANGEQCSAAHYIEMLKMKSQAEAGIITAKPVRQRWVVKTKDDKADTLPKGFVVLLASVLSFVVLLGLALWLISLLTGSYLLSN